MLCSGLMKQQVHLLEFCESLTVQYPLPQMKSICQYSSECEETIFYIQASFSGSTSGSMSKSEKFVLRSSNLPFMAFLSKGQTILMFLRVIWVRHYLHIVCPQDKIRGRLRERVQDYIHTPHSRWDDLDFSISSSFLFGLQ